MDQDNKIQNLNIMLNSLQQQLVSEKLKLRKTQTLLTSKRQLVQSSHALLERDFQGVFTDGAIKRRRWKPGRRPFGLVSLLETSAPDEVAAVEHSQESAQVTLTAWHSVNDDVIWVRARVRNTLKTPLYNVQLQTSSGLTRRSTAAVLQVDVEIDVCATYQIDPVHDVKQLDDLNLVYSFSDSGPNHCQRLRTGHVQDRSDLTWLTTVKDETGVPPSLYVYFAHWITLDDENEMDTLRQIGKMQRVVRERVFFIEKVGMVPIAYKNSTGKFRQDVDIGRSKLGSGKERKSDSSGLCGWDEIRTTGFPP
ncbi:hypothetical protein K450DRAFT_255106 [Umbelopsis ramanniana AG]|uniref:Uncharacterized protein n=1 Tax=Umbelopsis ramanniana AG TaxID=1314678 RepID=A0AAD5E511_UMBRA|nr:uncharacterized protein K450DRAFT_255106 [Umbelopsis ramanniana AG]KAI8576814.1 hypothetical protein K450DRAFT_255106 [Umbelopsis ramanniana AG]